MISELVKAKFQLDPELLTEVNDNIFISQVLDNLEIKVKEIDVLTKISTEHKELHVTISKFGKTIDKSFTIDTFKPEGIPLESNALNEVIAQHFFRQGKFDLGEMFIQESGIKLDSSLKEPFVEMYKILGAMVSQKNLQPAIQWAKSRRNQLSKIQSNLEFNLHKLQYIHYLIFNNRDEAIKYARQNFSDFATSHLKEIQKLMTSLLYIGRLDKSPYSSFLLPTMWSDITYDFTSACCTLLGLSYESPLYTSVTAGSLALPKQIKVASLLQSKNLKFQQIEFDLGPEFHFHPIFACPVSREQSTRDNPPMLLACGHVISKTSVVKLSRGNSRLKCPYCPTDQSISKAIQVKDLIKFCKCWFCISLIVSEEFEEHPIKIYEQPGYQESYRYK